MQKISCLILCAIISVGCTNNYKRDTVFRKYKQAIEIADYQQCKKLLTEYQKYSTTTEKESYELNLQEMYHLYACSSLLPTSENENSIVQAVAKKGYCESILYRITSIEYMFPIYDEHILEGNTLRNFRISEKELCEPIEDKTSYYENVSLIESMKRKTPLLVRMINSLNGGKRNNKYDTAYEKALANSNPRAEYYEVIYVDDTNYGNSQIAEAVIITKKGSVIFMETHPTKGYISQSLFNLISEEYGIEN